MPPKPSGLYYTHHNIPKPNDLENWSHSYYEEEILKAQKEAIWKKLQLLKRENSDFSQKLDYQQLEINNFKDKMKILACLILTFQDNLFPLMQSFGFNFDKITTDLLLSNLYQIDYNSEDLNQSLEDFETQFSTFSKYLENHFMPLKNQFHSLITKFNQDEGSLQQSDIKSFLNCQTWLLSLTNSNSHSNDDSETIFNTLEEQNRHLKADLESQKILYQQKLEEIDQLKTKLSSAEKKIDFLMLHPPKETEESETPKAPEPQIETKIAPDTDKIKQRLEKQIDTLIKEKSQLKIDFDRLKLQIFEVPTKKIEESYLFNQSQLNNARLKSENEILNSKVQELSNEIQQFHTDRNRILNETHEEITKRNEFLETSMSKTLYDLSRVRKHRDNLMTEIQVYKTKDDNQTDYTQALTTLTESQNVQINRLKSENQRLQTMLAHLSGNEDAVSFIQNNGDTNTIEDYRDKLIAYEKHLQSVIDKCSCGSANLPENTLSTTKYPKENGHSIGYGENDSNAENNGNDEEITSRQNTKIHELEKQLEIHKTTQVQLAKEVENAFQSWTILQNQASSKILSLKEKEDRILELMSEQTKLEQKVNSSIKERNQLNILIQSLKRHNEKQAEYIAKTEERINNQAVQLAIAERQVNTYKDGLLELENKSKTYAQENFLFIDRMKVFESQMKQMDQNLVERTKELEELRYNNSELKAQLKQSNKRVDSLTANGNTMLIDELNEKIDNLKTILKCPACNLNFKTHVINRCMHVFCEDCIQSRITTRQRKCPQCNEPFGVQDMKQLYL